MAGAPLLCLRRFILLQRQMLHLDQYDIPENLNYRRVALLSGYGQMRPSVIRRLVGWLTSAPNSISARTTASWPLLAAM